MKIVQILIVALVALIVIGVCVVGGVFLYRTISQPEATATVQAEVTVAPPTVESEADDSWERVQAAGKIIAGTSVDYPPFESYIAPGQIDGFDIALMDEIGRRLGVQIEYRDIAFDGLGPSLSQGQIDVAIAAISQTPEREALVDFSNVYLVSEDGVLALEDSDITIGSADDMAVYRVGVQRNTVYQDWFQTVLIDAGRMSSDNLFAYEKAEHAIRDLRDSRIDLVAMDAQAAQAAVEQGGVKLVAKGQGEQNYAIALPKGAAALKAKLDEAITGMYNDGTISDLARRYLGVAQVLPTPTPAPTSTPGPQPSCTDGLTLVKNLTQEGEMKPGQAFTKGWQVKNSGTCTWDTNYRLDYASGQKMGGEPVAVARQVAPGETYDFQVNLVAPLKSGDHQGIWQIHNARNEAFGERLQVNVRVVAGPTPTPAPTQTPVPGISFTVDRDHIKHGECVNFHWKVDNVQAVYFYPEGARWQDHGVVGEGSQKECPAVTTTYYLRVVNRDNSVEVQQITIYVEASADAPYIQRFTVDPPNQITLGQCVTLQWDVQNQVNKITITANNNVLWDNAPVQGSIQDCPAAAGAVGYGLQATGQGGTSQAHQNINVVDPATATPQPTAAPEEPVIYTFSVSPNQIGAGECVDINWSAGGGTSYVRLTRNGDVLADHDPLTGHEHDCLDQAGSYTYRLEALSDAGRSVYQEQTVSVSEGTPSNPLANTRWRATVVNGEVVLDGTSLTANFGPDGSLNGSSGCNTYSASYTVSGDSLSISPTAPTAMVCDDPQGILDQEIAFLNALESANSFTLEAGELYVTNAAGVIEFVAQEP